MLPNIACSYIRLGRITEARSILKSLKTSWEKGERVAAPIAMVYITLGEKVQAVEWLDKVYAAKYVNIVQLWSLRNLPKVSGLDKDPEIRAALTRIGMN